VTILADMAVRIWPEGGIVWSVAAMMGEKDFGNYEAKEGSMFNDAGYGALRVALLFGSAAVALALILVPIIQGVGGSGVYQAGLGSLDSISTGSIGSTRRYTIHRSVLQKNPSAICIIHEDSSKTGDCN
jgi:hypothetical protein